jgi:fucose 4-O-acetylase-like acetyltransferase
MDIRSDNWLQHSDSEYLKVLRALSIVMIVFGHVGGAWFYRPWTEFISIFVAIFFFISGAVSYNGFLKSYTTKDYLIKRIIGLIVPYYITCLIALIVYIFVNASLPAVSANNLLRWITISPRLDMMPFQLGQIWFLQTLMIITLISPILFITYMRYKIIFIIFLCCSVVASAFQLKYNIAPLFDFNYLNLFKPLVYSLFYCVGFIIIDKPRLRTPVFTWSASGLLLLISILLVKTLHLNPDYGYQPFPNLYYVTGSLCAIWIFLLLKSFIMNIYTASPIIQKIVIFLFYNTFAIFLLHTFSIFIAEDILGIVNPLQKTITYGIFKLSVVLVITLAIVPVFTKISSMITENIIILAKDKRSFSDRGISG